LLPFELQIEVLPLSFYFQVDIIDSLPEVFPRIELWVEEVLMDEGNAMILTLFVCLLTVLFLRERQRRQVVIPPHPNDVRHD